MIGKDEIFSILDEWNLWKREIDTGVKRGHYIRKIYPLIERKEVLILSRFQNLKYREIAELLGCSIGTVKAQVHRAIKDLKRIFLTLSKEASS